MTGAEYKALRERLGSQPEAARVLSVHPQTLSKRERGDVEVSREMEYALRYALEHPEAWQDTGDEAA